MSRPVILSARTLEFKQFSLHLVVRVLPGLLQSGSSTSRLS